MTDLCPASTPDERQHELKCWPLFFEAVASGVKPFEVRRDDRGYQPGDLLRLREWNPDSETYTGRECHRRVTYLLDLGAPMWGLDGLVVLGLGPADPSPASTSQPVASTS